jgi:hypothetical protein
MRPTVTKQRLELAELLQISPQVIRHAVFVDAFDMEAEPEIGAYQGVYVDIPQGYFMAVTHLELEGYPLVEGDYWQGDRGAPRDTVTCQWKLNDEPQTEQLDHRAFAGSCLLFFAQGNLELRLRYVPIEEPATIVTQRLNVRLDGFFVPLAMTNPDGGVTAVPAELSQSSSASGSLG